MALHIVHFIGPINANSACTVRNLCLQALQSGASEIELHMSTEGGNMTAGFALYFFLKSLPLPLTTHNIGSVESVGVAIFLGYSLQTYGLTFITISQSAFITALYVPAVPLFQWLVMRSAPHPMAWIGVALAVSGLLLLSGVDPLDTQVLGTGELLTLLGALAIAAEIVLIGKYAGRVDPRRVTVVQLIAASVLAFAAMPAANEGIPAFSWVGLACAGGLGVASVLIQWVMNWAQREVSPTRATLIYASEPIWGAAIGRLVGERLPPLALLGGMLVVLAVLVSEWRPGRRQAN